MIDLRDPTTGAPLSTAARLHWYQNAKRDAEYTLIEAYRDWAAFHSDQARRIFREEIAHYRQIRRAASVAWLDFVAEQTAETRRAA